MVVLQWRCEWEREIRRKLDLNRSGFENTNQVNMVYSVTTCLLVGQKTLPSSELPAAARPQSFVCVGKPHDPLALLMSRVKPRKPLGVVCGGLEQTSLENVLKVFLEASVVPGVAQHGECLLQLMRNEEIVSYGVTFLPIQVVYVGKNLELS